MTKKIYKADWLVTMSEKYGDFKNGAMLVESGVVKQIGKISDMPVEGTEIIDLRGYAIYPGLINTHHHFYQTLTRALPSARNVSLFGWLKTLYPIWGRMTPEDVRASSQTALAELAVSGCTTAADHLYIFPNGCRLDDEIEAGSEIGLRLHLSRGSMSLGESSGGLPPDRLVEKEADILKDSQRLIEHYHDPKPGSKMRIVLAPCSPFSVTRDLMREVAELASDYDVMLHTHLAETIDEENFCVEKFGCRPVNYMEQVGWMDGRSWFAHTVFANQAETHRLASCGCGVAHCPSSNMRLSSGIAPIRRYIEAGVKVGLGVDGSASNDGSNMMAEVRQSFLLARLAQSPGMLDESTDGAGQSLFDARAALRIATVGGAQTLGRQDIGCLEEGMFADFFALDLSRLEFAGMAHDPALIPVFLQFSRVDKSFVGGKMIVDGGRLLSASEESIVRNHSQAVKRLLEI